MRLEELTRELYSGDSIHASNKGEIGKYITNFVKVLTYPIVHPIKSLIYGVAGIYFLLKLTGCTPSEEKPPESTLTSNNITIFFYPHERSNGHIGNNYVKKITRAYYKTRPDNIDVLFIASPYAIDSIHLSWPPFEQPQAYGSNGRLKGVIDITYPHDQRSDLSDLEHMIPHEFEHKWVGTSVKILNDSFTHWSTCLSQNVEDPMGFLWKDNGDGTFTQIGKSDRRKDTPWTGKQYGNLTLFLMGVLPEDELKDVFYILPPQNSRGVPLQTDECLSRNDGPETTIRGRRIDITTDYLRQIANEIDLELFPDFPTSTEYSADLIMVYPENEKPHNAVELLTVISNAIHNASSGKLKITFPVQYGNLEPTHKNDISTNN